MPTDSSRNGAGNFLLKYALSSSAAVVAETVTYPLDITKTRLQIQGESASSAAILNKSVPHRGVLGTVAGIVREEGVLKLWQGVLPALYRHIVYTGCRMSFYEVLREHVFKKDASGHFPVWKACMCGLVSGSMAQFVASPTDLIKVRMQMEGRRRVQGLPPRIKNASHAFTSVLKESGIRGLWKGWVPNVQRAALVNMGDLTTYDTAKHYILDNTNLEDNYVVHGMASLCSGLVAATLGTPADVVKTRIMNQPIENGRGTLYKSSTDCLMKTVRQEGFFALYKGFIPIWARMAPWSLTFWISYEEIRKLTGASSF